MIFIFNLGGARRRRPVKAAAILGMLVWRATCLSPNSNAPTTFTL